MCLGKNPTEKPEHFPTRSDLKCSITKHYQNTGMFPFRLRCSTKEVSFLYVFMNNLHHFSTYINKFRTVQRRRCQNFCLRRVRLQTANCKLPIYKSNHMKQWQTTSDHQHNECWSTGYHAQVALCALCAERTHSKFGGRQMMRTMADA